MTRKDLPAGSKIKLMINVGRTSVREDIVTLREDGCLVTDEGKLVYFPPFIPLKKEGDYYVQEIQNEN